MNKWIPISVWTLVGILGVWVLWQRTQSGQENSSIPATPQDGRVMIDVPWEHLPAVGDFRLTNQNDQPFSSAAEVGHPYLVNFFFSTCPDICRRFNGRMKSILDQFDNTDLELVSITVDPETDTPELLAKYAQSFDADERWQFLTGQSYEIKQTGNFVFHVPLEKNTHTEKIILIDRWGKIRDWFDWNEPEEIARLKTTVDQVLSETEPPFGKEVRTRYALAGALAELWENQDWISEFQLTNRNGGTFYSRDMTGRVWLASFFFSTCPGICQVQNRHLAGYQDKLQEKDLSMISITTDPQTDTPAVLKDYARQFVSGEADWRFLTSTQPLLNQRIGSEFFQAAAGGGHHSSRVYVVDRWGNVRGDFDWQEPEQEIVMWELVERLNQEKTPPTQWTRISGGQNKTASESMEEDVEAEESDQSP